MAQDKLYLVFEFMKVDNEQVAVYMETESFWEKIHEQRVKNGDIIGWDLWSLKPGGEDQGFQYMTVNLYKDAVSMIDARKIPNNSIIEGDICSIGAGAVGISIALDWMDSKYKVILLEGGGFEYNEKVQNLYDGKTTVKNI